MKTFLIFFFLFSFSVSVSASPSWTCGKFFGTKQCGTVLSHNEERAAAQVRWVRAGCPRPAAKQCRRGTVCYKNSGGTVRHFSTVNYKHTYGVQKIIVVKEVGKNASLAGLAQRRLSSGGLTPEQKIFGGFVQGGLSAGLNAVGAYHQGKQLKQQHDVLNIMNGSYSTATGGSASSSSNSSSSASAAANAAAAATGGAGGGCSGNCNGNPVGDSHTDPANGEGWDDEGFVPDPNFTPEFLPGGHSAW